MLYKSTDRVEPRTIGKKWLETHEASDESSSSEASSVEEARID